jgi:hypothetical protein
MYQILVIHNSVVFPFAELVYFFISSRAIIRDFVSVEL